jgi:hypothetical protein
MKLRIKNIPIATILLATIFAIGILLFVNAYSKKGAFSTYSLWGGKETTVESNTKDSDNDGLKDWEEKLYGTDTLNPDTDADGYLDGEEINSGHNPMVKGPNDKQVFYPLPLGDKYNITNNVFTDFDSVLKSYIEQKDEYVRNHPEIASPEEYLSQTDQSTLNEMFKRAILYNEQDWVDKADKALEQMPEIFNIEISDTNINVSDNNDIDSIKTYADELISYLNSNDFLLKDGNLALLKDSATKNEFAEIDILIQITDDKIANLVDLTVPSSWKEIHKNALKIIIITRNIYVSVRGFETDPIKTMIAANKFQSVISLWDILTANIVNLNETQNLNLPL